MDETILRLNYIAGTIAILMIPLWFFCFIVWRIQLRLEKHQLPPTKVGGLSLI